MPTASRPVGVFILGDVAPRDLVGLSRQAERCGFSDLWFAEDYFMLSGFASAGIALQATDAINVGIGAVSNRVRHPAVTAMEASTAGQRLSRPLRPRHRPRRAGLGRADAPHAEIGAGLDRRGDR